MTQWSSSGLLTRIHPIPNSAALHQDDRMMTVLTKWCSRQTKHVTHSHLSQDLFETTAAPGRLYCQKVGLVVFSSAIVHLHMHRGFVSGRAQLRRPGVGDH